MIEFHCRNCNQKISVKDHHSGKRFRCSKCGNVGTVPGGPAKIKYCCENCSQIISIPETHAGKQARCPKCKSVFSVPSPPDKADAGRIVKCLTCDQVVRVPEGFSERLIECPGCGAFVDLQPQKAPAAEKEDAIQLSAIPEDDFEASALPSQEQPEEQTEETEKVGKRKLPWPIDILLYPANLQGIVTIGIVTLGQFCGMFCCYGWILRYLAYMYMYWYFCECIRDSAEGGLRAPITISIEATFSEMFWQSIEILACCIFFFTPGIIYRAYVTFTDTPVNNIILWSLRSYGIFFFPMGILAVVMFNSLSGLNPVLIVRSIISVFFQYCGLVILFYSLAILYLFGVMGAGLSTAVAAAGTESILTKLFSGLMFFAISYIAFIWIFFIAGHLLGRFYWKYQERLYWEV